MAKEQRLDFSCKEAMQRGLEGFLLRATASRSDRAWQIASSVALREISLTLV